MRSTSWINPRGTKGNRATIGVVLAACAAFVWIACGGDDPQVPPGDDGPPPAGLTDPIWEYPRSSGQSITGGYVYRGDSLVTLVGKYVYADHLSRHIWALTYDGTTATNEFLVDAPNNVSSFGVAEDGELFVCGYNSAPAATTPLYRLRESGGVYSTVDAFPNLSFERPVDLQNAGDGTDRLFVVEQRGVIRVFPNDASAATTSEFLDISGVIVCCGELGMLGLAFHPDYENNGFFYVYYSTSVGGLKERLSRFQVSAGDPDDADESTEEILLEINDRQGNHNGGALCFDADGYLYVATGDEGGGGDLYDNAQNRAVLFGKILRLDVDQNVNVIPFYGIPADNPFVGNTSGYREEIFAWGLRNPWRMSYDAVTDRIWVGDVGQGTHEEIDIIESGKNYGWDCREGAHDYVGPPGGPSPACPQ